MNEKSFWSLPEIAKRFGVSLRTSQRWVRNGKMRAIRIGSVTRIRNADLLEFENRFSTGLEAE